MPYGPQILTSVGIELEVAAPTENQVADYLSRSRTVRGWRGHHDGSTQNQGYTYPGLPYTLRSLKATHGGDLRLGRTTTTGAEIVSPILDTTRPDWSDPLGNICDWLITKAKEIPSYRTSTHVHVNAGSLPLYTLKNLLRFWQFLEAPMFRLSVGELPEHRGSKRKNYSYCRPLSAPPVVFDRYNILRPSYNIEALLKSTTLEEFFTGYGACDVQSEPIHYHPARYSALNLLSMLTIHTVEFRTFNESTNPDTIKTWVELSQAILTAAVHTKGIGDDEYPKLPLGYNGDFELTTMQTMLDLPDSLMYRLEAMWDRSDWQPFNGINLFNSNNDNYVLGWPGLDLVSLPPSLDGTPVMGYAPSSNGRRSENEMIVFDSYETYRRALDRNYLTEAQALDAVANWKKSEPRKDEAKKPRPDGRQVEPMPTREGRRPVPTLTMTSTGRFSTSAADLTDDELSALREQLARSRYQQSAEPAPPRLIAVPADPFDDPFEAPYADLSVYSADMNVRVSDDDDHDDDDDDDHDEEEG